jgi:hypothetical protein
MYVVAAGDVTLYRTPSESAAFSFRAWLNNANDVLLRPGCQVFRDTPGGLVHVDRVGMLRTLAGDAG